MGIGSVAKRLAYRAAVATGAARRRRAADAAPVFCFHNVVDAAPRGERSLHVPRADFERYLAFVAGAYEVVPLGDLAARLAAGRTVRGLAALTFDDACLGVVRHAAPLMAARGLPYTVFVVSGATAARATFWWDRMAEAGALDGAARERCLTSLRGDGRLVDEAYPAARDARLPDDYRAAGWDELRGIAGAMTVGGHTATHRNLAALAPDERRAELRESADALAEHFGARPALLAYPYGLLDDDVVRAAAETGYAAAVSMVPGTASAASPALALPRVNVPAGLSLDVLECWAAGLRLRRP